jgi:hypothetical protein
MAVKVNRSPHLAFRYALPVPPMTGVHARFAALAAVRPGIYAGLSPRK